MGRGVSPMGGGGGGGSKKGNTPLNATALTEEEAEALRQQYESGFDAATKKSVDKYISNTNFDGDMHSLSQVMNHAINSGVDLQTVSLSDINSKLGLNLTQTQLNALKKTDANIDAAMHPLGADTILQRGAHAGELKRNFGISNYANMSEAELQAKLVGATFQNKAVMSTSFDVKKNPFLGSGPYSGGREVVYTIKAGKNTPSVFGATNQSEIILGKNVNWRVTGVKFTGKMALPKSTMKKTPQIEIQIETY